MSEAIPEPSIDRPTEGDAQAVGAMHLQAWHETYLSENHGIDADWIASHVAFVADSASTAFRQDVFRRQDTDPTVVLYRTVHVSGEVVGFLHAERDGRRATLEGLYLLHPLHGTGVADRLMTVFDTWCGGRPAGLDVISFNERAISFYTRHGFVTTGDQSVWKDVVPVTHMVRDPRPGSSS